jgi:Rrf2 family cysteine metabolism transcriptional repressor
VKSVKGAQGGYILAEAPADIKVGRILRALEGSLSVIDQGAENTDGNETSIQHCIRISVWDKMNESLNELVDSLTLEDLANKYRQKNGIQDIMYYI